MIVVLLPEICNGFDEPAQLTVLPHSATLNLVQPQLICKSPLMQSMAKISCPMKRMVEL